MIITMFISSFKKILIACSELNRVINKYFFCSDRYIIKIVHCTLIFKVKDFFLAKLKIKVRVQSSAHIYTFLPTIWKLEYCLFIKSLRTNNQPIAHALLDVFIVYKSFPFKQFFQGRKQKMVRRGQIWTVGRVVQGFPVNFFQFISCQNHSMQPVIAMEKNDISDGHTPFLLTAAAGNGKLRLLFVDSGDNQ